MYGPIKERKEESVCGKSGVARLLRKKEKGRWKRIGQAAMSGSLSLPILGKPSSLKIVRHMQAEKCGLAGSKMVHMTFTGFDHGSCTALERRKRRTNCSSLPCTPDGVLHPAGSR